MMRTKDALFFLGGAALGAAIALLYAPESGQKTRRRIKRFVEDEKDKLTDAYDNVRERIEHGADKLERRLKRG